MKSLSLLLRHTVISVMFLSVLLVLSCQRQEVVDVSPESNESSDPTLDYILSLGFNKGKIVNYGKFYAVEGDIMFDKSSIPDKRARPSQLAHFISPLVDYDIVDNITVRVGTFPDDTRRNKMITATQAAINSWNNNISNKKLHFTYTSGPSASITVQDATDIGTLYAMASFPNCSVGSLIKINRTTPPNLTANQLHFIMAHELGHCIGLRHTDEGIDITKNYKIYGTPYSDDASIMNTEGPKPVNGVPVWTNFSNDDKTAVQKLYPSLATGSAVNNGGTGNIDFTWTTSNFCEKYVNVQITLPSGIYLQPVNVTNTGIYSFEPESSGTYTVSVFDNSSAALSGSVYVP